MPRLGTLVELGPRLKWNLGPAQLPGIGETWSTPTIARVRIDGAEQNGENLALIFGGGQLHRTHVTPAMHRRRVSIELRFIAGGATPPRLEREPRVAAFRCSSTR